jgi:hypothetical protein
MKTTAKMPASLHKAVKLGMSTVLATGTFAIIGANPAQADGVCLSLTLGLNSQCNHSEADFEVSNVIITNVEGFSVGARASLSYNHLGYSINPQLTLTPASLAPFSASLQYTITLKNGRTFDTAEVNIGGVNGPFTTTTNATSGQVSASSTNGAGATMNFSTAGLTTQTFIQTFSATGGNVSSIGSTYGTTGPLPAPGPLPLLGVGAAFGFSRKLRRRIQLSA